ncbi:GNAT family N-acetyltransferase [Planotetraspora phitsanulokensis]|uniref:Acetyltransferase n=1 Tax=Planotetraspora phitsanulokensis TaxID=575192 RepID=A0A8J3UJQ1_9ACTN|nr:GNAT family N-acetyltransferase [Planotetraspora phitsanulokensis]GII40035.1 acetyltransferase [Planotetraspora phitsanulokensis]
MPSHPFPVVAPGWMRDNEQPDLRAGDLLLRSWLPHDAPAVLAAFSDPAIQRWHRRSMTSLDQAADWIAQWPVRWRTETDACWAVTDPAADEVLGRVSLRDIHLAEGLAQVTYWILPDARGREVSVRAAVEATRWAFEDLGLHRVELHHSTYNTASCLVADKAGFAYEGTLRSALLHADGWHDMEVHARINEPARARRP